jgi:hypothetical protein
MYFKDKPKAKKPCEKASNDFRSRGGHTPRLNQE